MGQTVFPRRLCACGCRRLLPSGTKGPFLPGHRQHRHRCHCGCRQPIPWKPYHKYRPPRFLAHHVQRAEASRASRIKLRLTPPPDVLPLLTGLCGCGCGQPTPIVTNSRPRWIEYAGYPARYLHGHHLRAKRGATTSRWNGGRWRNRNGYWLVWKPGHSEANNNGYVLEHRLVWEQVHGRVPRSDEHIHHLDGHPGNNDPANLVALSQSEHSVLHNLDRRTKGQISRLVQTVRSDLEVGLAIGVLLRSLQQQEAQ